MCVAVIIREIPVCSTQPKQSAPQGEVVIGNSIVDIKTQGQIGEQVGVLVDLLNGKVECQYILVVLPKPAVRLKIASVPQNLVRK